MKGLRFPAQLLPAPFLAALLLVALAAPTALAQVAPAPKVAMPSFQDLDADKSGHLTRDEVLAYAKKQSAGQGGGQGGFQVKTVDKDGSGSLSSGELRAAGMQALYPFGAVDLKELDADGDGVVTQREIDDYVRRKHLEAFAKADHDQDGTLHPKDFALYRFSIGPQE